ncbi:MAG: limonene-1,2-epoxide hydrolase family protein [Myxococcota bacterium]|nr:limonene-1,2-epoxide hydrolase family protein [Myxococcota bacterium]
MADPESVVRDFCNAFSRCDIEELLGYFAEGAVYHNIPLPAAEGIEAIRTTLEQFLDPSGEAKFEIRHLAVAGNAVLTERVDYLTIQGKKISIPVMGTFEVDGAGKITAWRDYFDMNMLTQQIS